MKSLPLRTTGVSLIGLIFIYAICFVWLDRPIDVWLHLHAPTSIYYAWSIWIGEVCKSSHWSILALLAIFIGLACQTGGRKQTGKNWLLIAFSVLIAQFVCLAFKVILGRYRPELLFSEHLYGFHFLATKHAWTSSPSGHTTSAFATLFAIGYACRKYWLTVLLLLCAAVIAISRVIITAHYPSDVIFGAYIGIITVVWLNAIFSNPQGEQNV